MEYTFRCSPMHPVFQPRIKATLEMLEEQLSPVKDPAEKAKIEAEKAKGLKKRNTIRYILGIAALAVGAYLFIPGLLNPETMQGRLMGGAAVVILGLFILSINFYGEANLLDRRAKELWGIRNKLLEDKKETLDVIFNDESMILSGSDMERTIPYSQIQFVFDHEDMVLVVCPGEDPIPLKKVDLIDGEEDEFLSFLAEKVTLL